MRCPECAGEMPPGSRFCGVCGHQIPAPTTLPTPAFRPPPERASAAFSTGSLFQLPVSRSARLARFALVIAINVALAGTGIALINSYFNKRSSAANAAESRGHSPTGSERAARGPEATAKRQAAPAIRPATKVADKLAGSGRGSNPAPAKEAPVPVTTKPGIPEPTEAELTGFARKVALVSERNASQTQLQSCYSQAAAKRSTSDPLEGRVDISFEVMPSGIARNQKVTRNTTGSAELGRCVSELVAAWTYPRPPGDRPLEFRSPFLFRSAR